MHTSLYGIPLIISIVSALSNWAVASEGIFTTDQVKSALSFNPEVAREVNVAIYAENKQAGTWLAGNGIFISQSGHILTNAHLGWGCPAQSGIPASTYALGYDRRAGHGVVCHNYFGVINVGTSSETRISLELLAAPTSPKVEEDGISSDVSILKALTFQPRNWIDLKERRRVSGADEPRGNPTADEVFVFAVSPVTNRGQKFYSDVTRPELRVSRGHIQQPSERSYFRELRQHLYYADTDGLTGWSGGALYGKAGSYLGMVFGPGDTVAKGPEGAPRWEKYSGGNMVFLRAETIWARIQSYYPNTCSYFYP